MDYPLRVLLNLWVCNLGHVSAYSSTNKPRCCMRFERTYLVHDEVVSEQCGGPLEALSPEEEAAYHLGGEEAVRAMHYFTL